MAMTTTLTIPATDIPAPAPTAITRAARLAPEDRPCHQTQIGPERARRSGPI